MIQKNKTLSPGQSSPDPSFTTQEQVRLLYMQAPVSNSAVIIISLLYYYLLGSHVDPGLLLYWVALMFMSALYRLFLWYSRKNRPESKSTRSWLIHYLAGCGLVGICWSLAYPFVYQMSDVFLFAALSMLIFGVIGSAVPILSPYLPAFAVYTYPQALVFIVTLLSFGDIAYGGLAFAVGVYIVMMTLFARNANRSILQSIKLQEGNARLIRDLNDENNKRESIIAKRTLELEQKNDELIREIENKEQAESKLKQSNADLAATLQAIPDLLFEVNEKGVYIDLWTQDAELLVAQKDALIGHTVTEILPAEAVHEAMDAIREAAELGTSHGQVYSLPLEQGERWFELSTARKPMTDGSSHFIVIARDITDKRQIETELEQYRQDLEQKITQRTSELIEARDQAEGLSRVKTEFLANMSHEIRTPMNAVLGLAQMGERGIPAEKIQQTFEQIVSSGQHLLEVINDILDFSKIEAGKLVVESRPFRLGDAVDNVINLLKGRARARKLVLKVNMDKNLPTGLLGDARRLQQVLINLLSNAIKFSSQGEVLLTVKQDNELTRFQVTDTGIGMTQEEISRLFSPFEQADGSTTRKYGGTGLGLAISYNLAHLMDGEIDVESEPGVGSSFTLSLPLPATDPTMPFDEYMTPAIKTDQQLSGLHILAAEDVEINRVILQELLEHEGATVVFGENGQQLLDQLNKYGESSFDVVLMDVQMPVMDGYEATRQVSEIAPGLPVIAVTAHAMDEERDKCVAAGMVDHVTKPIEADDLILAIHRHVKSFSDGSKEAPADKETVQPTAVSRTLVEDTQERIHTDPLIDREALLQRFKNRKIFIDKLILTVQTTYGHTAEELRKAAKEQDMLTLSGIAHKLKSVAGNFEAQQLYELAIQTEKSALAAKSNSVILANELATLFEKLLNEMEVLSSEP